MTKSQSTSQGGFATLVKYSTNVLPNERAMLAYRDAWSQLSSARACCPVGVPRLHHHKLHGWTTAVNVKRLLPPRQSRGTSLGCQPAKYLRTTRSFGIPIRLCQSVYVYRI